MPPRSDTWSAKGPQRIGGSRVKSACQTCKKRHLKCDEGRPNCQKCSRAGFPCIYAIVESANKNQQRPLRIIQYKLPIHAGPNDFPDLNADEIRAIEFYQLHSADELSGFFSSRLWSKIIPQIASTEPAIRYALLAISDLHESFRFCRSKDTGLAIQHYSRAIRHVVNVDNLESCSLDTILASCVLFAVIEIFRGHYSAALSHVSSGLKLLSSGHGQKAGDDASVSLFRDTLLYFDTQAIEIGDVSYQLYSTPTIEGQLQTFPETFSCLEDAYYIFNGLFNRFTRIWQWFDLAEQDASRSTPSKLTEILAIYSDLHQYCLRWGEALSRSLFDQSEPGMLILLINKTIMNIMFNTIHLGMVETDWDGAAPQFRQAVELAEQLVGTESNAARRPTISTSMGIVTSLYLIATRCRQAEMRGRALRLLKGLNCMEGIWDSNGAASMAEHIIELENAGALSISGEEIVTESWQIPESARVKELELIFEDGAITEVKYKTSQDVLNS